MNDAEKKLAADVAKKMLLTLGLKWLIIIAITKTLKRSVKESA